MSRTFFGALLLLISAVLPTVSWGQISFVPGTPRKVPLGPAFITTDADFNNDGIRDAVVSSTVRDTVTVLFGSPDANFAGSVVEIPTGRLLRDVATGDFNGDRLPDIAVADNYSGGVFIISGQTGASFSSPQFFAGQPRGPYDVATGHFDTGNSLDVVIANRTRDTFTIFTNQGGTRGLSSVGNFPTGNGPRSVLTSDLNGDHFDDLIILDTADRGTDEVAVFLNQGTGTFQGIIPQRFVVGVGAVAMTSGDFNGDGKLDLAILNAAGAGLNNFTVSILLGSVNPMFKILPPAVFGCPSHLNGIQIVCLPQDIKAADFDSDSFQDLVISFSTKATDTQQSTSGFVNAYGGRGNGSFDFGEQIIVGLGPRRIATGDVTGDGVPDVTVTAYTDSTVQVLRSKTPPLKKNGQPCVVGHQCESGSCIDNVCCGTASCPAGQFCDILPNLGTCSVPAPPGTPCTDIDGSQCSTHACVDGFCCTTLSCMPGFFCNTGVCSPPAGNGTQCNEDAECSSTHCNDGVCCSDEACAVDAACNIPGSEGVCTTRLPPGQPCTDPRQCCTSTTDITACDPSFCQDGFCCERECLSNETCNAPGFEGRCVPAPAKTSTPTRTPTATPIPTPAGNGSICTFGTNCLSGNCVDGRCCSSPSCASNESCSMPGHEGMCSPRNPNGQACNGNQDCTSGFCNPNKVCDNPPTATPTSTPLPVPPGGACSNTSQCVINFVCNNENVCCATASCPSGQSCHTSANPGVCTILPPTSTPAPTFTAAPTPRSLGDPCTATSQCDADAFCTDGFCCDQDACTRPDRCDIAGHEGICGPPLFIDETCNKNSDCETNFCNPSLLRCEPFPSPTPTLFIPPPLTPTPDIRVDVSRSGGCAIDDTHSRSNSIVLLAGLPFAFWFRRRWAKNLVRARSLPPLKKGARKGF